jgi:HSP20 family protein
MRRVPYRQFREEMDRVMSDVWGTLAPLGSSLVGRNAFPAVNVWETDDDVLAEAELPGVSQEGLELDVVGSELTIRGERNLAPTDGTTFHRQERSTGKFRRTLRLPVEVDADKVEAKLHDGVLSVRLPKAARAKPRKIQVSVG